jgi:hypothetical protein
MIALRRADRHAWVQVARGAEPAEVLVFDLR